MAKKKDKQEQDHVDAPAPSAGARQEADAGPPPKMKCKEYEGQMRILHGELVAMQEWVKASGAKICVVFEGRDTAGIVLLRYWLEVSPGEQTRRLESRMHDPRKVWKLSPMDLRSYSRWYDYSRARDAMFAATDTGWAPWYIAHADDKKRARLNIISHMLSQVPYKPLAPRDIKLPKRQPSGGYVEPDLPLRYIPTPF